MTPNQPSRVLFLAFPALTMSLGWALRGFIGGGPLGAMIPGAMVALALALLLKLPPGVTARAAAFGAVAVGFGGEMTYGQTVGFAGQAETMGWGLLGLAVKGGVWGLLGGAVAAAGFVRGAFTSRRIVGAFALMAGACWAGWRLVNQPKLIYFSNLADRPREEVWAGLLAAGIAVLLVLRHPAVTRFALLGAAGGFAGFGGGGLFIALHRIALPDWKWLPSWKLMEYSFGLLFGLALAAAAWGLREQLAAEPEEDAAPPGWPETLGATVFAVFSAVFLAEKMGVRFEFLLAGAMLLATLLAVRWLAWHVALTMTFACFAWDLAENLCERMQLAPMAAGWVFLALSSLFFWRIVDARARSAPPMARFAFHLLLWSAMAAATVKTAAQILVQPHFPSEYPLFVASALGVAWMERRAAA